MMNWRRGKTAGLVTASLGLAFLLGSVAGAQTTFGGNAQHTAVYSPAAQNLNSVRWTTSIDLNNTGGYAHYGAPVITPANTIFVPVKTGATGGFQINAFNAANGAAIYSLSTDYIQPSHGWILPYQPALATSGLGTRLYYPGAGGTIYYVDNVDSAGHGAPVQQVFYTTLANYLANKPGFDSTVFINTPITADSSGNVFFGFRVDGTAPAPLGTTQSGFARIDPNGNATYVVAGTAAGDANIGRDTHNSAPALSNDQATVYVAVKSASTDSYGYLLGLDSSTLATKYKVFLKDPRNNHANNARLLDNSTSSPMVGPDNDVYFGIYGNPANGSRGFLLHFSGDLTVEKTPGGFGWDNTTAVVPATMVPSYTGTSSYLLFTKYNNYAGAGDGGDGVNRIALLDPNATQVDAHASSNGMLVMREVLTVIGPTADAERRSAGFPLAVREWCINTAAVNPATNSVFVPNEDGRFYRWNLVSNSLTQFVQLNTGIGQPYVPTIIGPDGTVFTLNGGTLSAVGSLSGVGVGLTSSAPDVRSVVTGQSLTFTVAVTNTGTSGITPTGTVTLEDTVYFVPSPGVLNSTTTTLGTITLVNGTATLTTSALSGDTHFITASYSGDANFSAGKSSLVQFVHANGSATALASSSNPSIAGQPVTFTATVAAAPPGSGAPTGMVTFQDGNTVLAQIPLSSSGVASFTTSSLALGSHTVTAVYASDTSFAASSGSTVQSVQSLNATATTASSSPNPSVFGQPVTFTSTTTSSGGVPMGKVTFTEGSTVLAANVTVDGSGHASFSTTALGVGSHTITATFTGAIGWANSGGNAPPQVVMANDFTISASPGSQSAGPATNNIKYAITVGSLGGFNSNVAFSLTGLPTGAKASFSPTSVNGADNSTLTINTGTGMPGTYSLTITGTSGTRSHSTSVSLTILPPDFTITPSSSNPSTKQGQSTTPRINIGALYGFTGSVALSVTSTLPAGLTATFNPASITKSGNSNLTLTPYGTPAGRYPLTVTGTSGSLSHSANLTLTVSLGGDISVAANPAVVSISRSSTNPSRTTTITISSTDGFAGNATLTASGLPGGGTASFSPTTVSVSPGTPATATMTLSVSPTTNTGNSNVNVTGNSGGGPKGTTKVTLQVVN